KIEPNAFASAAVVEGMMKELEELFAARFTHGDKKRAIQRLRGGTQHKSHHFSTFRSGLYIGLALPALVHGLYLSEYYLRNIPLHAEHVIRLPRRCPRKPSWMGWTTFRLLDFPGSCRFYATRWAEPPGLVVCSYQLRFHFR
ncbi:hypothetical protein K474DRAFT_1596224, partial [Panus rudis PR-1116 ss-1]